MTETEPVLERVARGDQAAVAECLERYGDLIWSLALRFTRNRAEAEDAVQEIFIDLWKHAGRYDRDVASEATFVATIARRRLIDRLRKLNRAPGIEQLDTTLPADEASPQERLETKDEADRATRLLATLRPEQQRVLRLSIYHGYSHGKIAELTRLPLGTVKTHLRRGLLRIREELRGGEGGETLKVTP